MSVCIYLQAALADCQWALRVDEKCVKAAVLQGNAYVGLRQYQQAIDSYSTAQQAAGRRRMRICNLTVQYS